jgi:steroid delta-isomerase-like uncharacterized protein
VSEENKALALSLIQEVWGKKNLDNLDKFIAADIVDPELPPGFPAGRDGMKAFPGMFLNAFPDTNMVAEDQIAEGDLVVTRWVATGTHKGELMGIPATGKKITVEGIDIHRISGGKSVEHWLQFDQMGMIQQLGVIPAPGQ